MRGKIAVVVIVLLACALFLVPYASAKVDIDCSVYPEKAGYNTDFVYSITLTNSGTFITLGNLKLIVGSDSDITREWEVGDLELVPGSECKIEYGKLRIPAGKSCTVKKRVQFTHHKLYQGAFKEWADAEKPDPPEWHKAWYEWFFIDTRSEKVSCDGSGKPILTLPPKVIFQELPPVEQNEVYKGLSFDYDVQVWANCEDRIELQVRNYNTSTSPDGWDKLWLKNYTELDLYTNKTLTWYAVNLTLDNFRNGQGLYKVVGNTSESQPYSGPKIEERFDDPRVSYKKTINELLSFDYEVTAWVNWAKSSIRLEVYNYHLHEWEEKGIRNYTTPSNYQKLRWESINLCSDYFDDDHSGKYRFVGSYNKDKLEIIGPKIEEKFYDLGVTPIQGKNNVTFNYSVTVNANISDKIVLQVKNHTNNDWYSKGTRDYTTPNINETLTWHNIQLNTHELNRHNDSIFRFVGMCDAKSSEKGLGLPIWPINPFFKNPSVKPERGLYSENFYYSVDVKAEKNGIVNLSIFCPDGILLCETKLDYNKAPEWQTLNWPVQNFNGCDVKTGDAGFRFGFWYKGEIINLTGEEPYIGIAKFGNERVEPEIGTEGTLFNYTINVTAAHEGTVELLIKCPEGTHWDTGGEKEYETSKATKTLTWTRIELPYDICGNAEYMFKFEPGHVLSENYTGPELIIEDFGALIVAPEKGTNYTPFNFSIDFSTSKPRNVTLWARYDECEWELIESKPVASKRETILFSNITPSKVFRSIEWKCTGIVSESEITFTNWDIGLKWQNRSVSPKEEGWWNEGFDFSVSLSANVPGDVVLMVKEEDTNVWMAVGNNRPYTGSPNPQTLTWENERIFNFNNPYEGNTSYNFTFYWGKTGYAATPSYGPKLYIPLNISISSADVIPNDGVLYNFKDYIFMDNNNKHFNFSITMTAEKPTAVKLVLVDPAGNEHTLNDEQKCKYTTPYQPLNCSWTMIELPSEEDVGEWEYTYSYYDTRFGGWNMSDELFNGPDIIAVFNSYELDPAPPIPYGEECNVTICMSGLEKMDVTLEAYNLIHNGWESVGTKLYEPAGEKCLRWVIDTFEVPFDKLRLKW